MRGFFGRSAFLLLAVSILFSGCAGYRVGSIAGANLQGIRTVYVPVAINKSLMPQISVAVTDAVIRRFDNDGTLATVRDPSQADSQLDVTITEIRRFPMLATRTNVLVTAEYQMLVTAQITFTNKRTGRAIFNNVLVNGTTSFFVQNDQQEGERQAFPLAAENLAYNIVKTVAEGW